MSFFCYNMHNSTILFEKFSVKFLLENDLGAGKHPSPIDQRLVHLIVLKIPYKYVFSASKNIVPIKSYATLKFSPVTSCQPL